MGTYRFPFDLRSLLALVALAWLASFAHEFSHHAAGALACGRVGRMSLSLFVVDTACGARWPWSTIAGPLLSYALMWWGMALLLRGRHPWWGFALVIANKPVLRLVTALAGGGDEGVLWDLVTPVHGRWWAAATVSLLCMPPLLACWRALHRRRRAAVLVGALLLPMLPILPVPFIDQRLYGAWIAGHARHAAGFGVPWSVWWIEAAVALLLVAATLAMPRRAAALTVRAAT